MYNSEERDSRGAADDGTRSGGDGQYFGAPRCQLTMSVWGMLTSLGGLVVAAIGACVVGFMWQEEAPRIGGIAMIFIGLVLLLAGVVFFFYGYTAAMRLKTSSPEYLNEAYTASPQPALPMRRLSAPAPADQAPPSYENATQHSPASAAAAAQQRPMAEYGAGGVAQQRRQESPSSSEPPRPVVHQPRAPLPAQYRQAAPAPQQQAVRQPAPMPQHAHYRPSVQPLNQQQAQYRQAAPQTHAQYRQPPTAGSAPQQAPYRQPTPLSQAQYRQAAGAQSAAPHQQAAARRPQHAQTSV